VVKICITCKQEKPEDAFREKRGDCRECERAKHRAWYAKQETKPYEREELKVYWKKWYKANSGDVKRRAVEWAKKNPGKRHVICLENMRRQREKLCDAYVRRMLAASVGLKSRDMPQQLVEVQRELLKLKRELRNDG
jgi:hypothetical protein